MAWSVLVLNGDFVGFSVENLPFDSGSGFFEETNSSVGGLCGSGELTDHWVDSRSVFFVSVLYHRLG